MKGCGRRGAWGRRGEEEGTGRRADKGGMGLVDFSAFAAAPARMCLSCGGFKPAPVLALPSTYSGNIINFSLQQD